MIFNKNYICHFVQRNFLLKFGFFKQNSKLTIKDWKFELTSVFIKQIYENLNYKIYIPKILSWLTSFSYIL